MSGKCEAGCMHYEGGEKSHVKECFYYPESLTKIRDDLKKELLKRDERIVATVKRADDLLEYGLLKSNWKNEHFKPTLTCLLLYLQDEIKLLQKASSLQKQSIDKTPEIKNPEKLLTPENAKEFNKNCETPEYSDCYAYKGGFEFDNKIEILVGYKSGHRPVHEFEVMREQINSKQGFELIDFYQIKLDGVKVYEYEYSKNGEFAKYYAANGNYISHTEILGHDPHNKTIIIKQSIDKET